MSTDHRVTIRLRYKNEGRTPWKWCAECLCGWRCQSWAWRREEPFYEGEEPPGGYAGRGCDWCAFGLFRGPVFIEAPDPDGGEPHLIPSFRVAPAPEVTA